MRDKTRGRSKTQAILFEPHTTQNYSMTSSSTIKQKHLADFFM